MQKVFGFALVLVSGATMAGWFGPSTYAECVLENMKGIGGDVAASAVKRACFSQFPLPPQEPAPPPLPPNPTDADVRAYKARQAACLKSAIERENEAIYRSNKRYGFDKFDCGK